MTGGACGVAASIAALLVLNANYSSAKARASQLPEVPVPHGSLEALGKQTTSRQHVVFLLGPPLTNRSIIAQRLTRNRHLAHANGGPVALEFDDCVPKEFRDRIMRGERLTEAELDAMVDAAIERVQQVADERPVIFSAFLPLVRQRKRFLLAFGTCVDVAQIVFCGALKIFLLFVSALLEHRLRRDRLHFSMTSNQMNFFVSFTEYLDERTVIRLEAPADELVRRSDLRTRSHASDEGTTTPPASPPKAPPSSAMVSRATSLRREPRNTIVATDTEEGGRVFWQITDLAGVHSPLRAFSN